MFQIRVAKFFLIPLCIVLFGGSILAIAGGNFVDALLYIGLIFFYNFLYIWFKAKMLDAQKFLKEHEHTKFRKDLHAK